MKYNFVYEEKEEGVTLSPLINSADILMAAMQAGGIPILWIVEHSLS